MHRRRPRIDQHRGQRLGSGTPSSLYPTLSSEPSLPTLFLQNDEDIFHTLGPSTSHRARHAPPTPSLATTATLPQVDLRAAGRTSRTVPPPAPHPPIRISAHPPVRILDLDTADNPALRVGAAHAPRFYRCFTFDIATPAPVLARAHKRRRAPPRASSRASQRRSTPQPFAQASPPPPARIRIVACPIVPRSCPPNIPSANNPSPSAGSQFPAPEIRRQRAGLRVRRGLLCCQGNRDAMGAGPACACWWKRTLPTHAESPLPVPVYCAEADMASRQGLPPLHCLVRGGALCLRASAGGGLRLREEWDSVALRAAVRARDPRVSWE